MNNEAYADLRYNNILVLYEKLRNNKIPCVLCRLYDGWQILYPDVRKSGTTVKGDIISHKYSDGGGSDLLEIMGFGVDNCVGNLTVDEAFDVVKAFHNRVKMGGTLCSTVCSNVNDISTASERIQTEVGHGR